MAKGKPKTSSPPPEPPQTAAPEPGLALDELSQALQSLFTGGDDPYSVPASPDDDPLLAAANLADSDRAASSLPVDESNCELGPRSILEALLFVGTPDNQPLSSTQLAGLMRGVSIPEVDELIAELNAGYRAANSPYRIESVGDGYRMALARRGSPCVNRFTAECGPRGCLQRRSTRYQSSRTTNRRLRNKLRNCEARLAGRSSANWYGGNSCASNGNPIGRASHYIGQPTGFWHCSGLNRSTTCRRALNWSSSPATACYDLWPIGGFVQFIVPRELMPL